MKFFLKELNKWRANPYAQIEDNIAKMPVPPKLIYTFIATPIQISANYFVILKRGKRRERVNTVLKENNKSED